MDESMLLFVALAAAVAGCAAPRAPSLSIVPPFISPMVYCDFGILRQSRSMLCVDEFNVRALP